MPSNKDGGILVYSGKKGEIKGYFKKDRGEK
jgi:hypothetical protein